MRKLSDLHPYQERGRQFIHDRKRCGLFLDMGLGKTVTSLTATSDLLDGFAVARVLVIAPLRVANSVWKQEAANWEHLKGLRVSIVTGSEKQRRSALMRTADIFVINRENTQWLVRLFGKRWPFDAVIIDESSSFKNPAAKRFGHLRHTMPYTDYLVLLTGTPSPKGLIDLWSQMFLIDAGKALGRTFQDYKRRFFDTNPYSGEVELKDGAEKQIHDLIRPHIVSMSAEDYLDVPERIDLVETVTLPPAVMKQYREFEKTLLLELGDGVEVEAANAGILANKLLQFANGAIYTDKMKNWAELHQTKLDTLEELIEENSGEPILVPYNFKTDLIRLRKRFPTGEVLGKDDAEGIARWNRGEIPLLFIHPQSAGHGLNLQYGGSLIIWFSLTWPLEYYQQLVGRLDRQGQTKPTRNLRIVAEGTIDERVLSVWGMRGATQSALVRALKMEKVTA